VPREIPSGGHLLTNLSLSTNSATSSLGPPEGHHLTNPCRHVVSCTCATGNNVTGHAIVCDQGHEKTDPSRPSRETDKVERQVLCVLLLRSRRALQEHSPAEGMSRHPVDEPCIISPNISSTV
jgi:hypothetical protein